MGNYRLYVDGGGNATVRAYFSYLAYNPDRKMVKTVRMNRFYLDNLSKGLLPTQCSTVNNEGNETNNIAEYCALYYGLVKFKSEIGTVPVTVNQDSKIILYQVAGDPEKGKLWSCNIPWLKAWRNAIWRIAWDGIEYEWVSRNIIVAELGH